MRTLLILIFLTLQLYGTGTLSTKTYKWLLEVQELMEKKEYNLALDSLSKLETIVNQRPFDMAYVHQTFGYIYMEMEKPEFAVRRFQKALEGDVLPLVQRLNILQNLAAFHMQAEEFAKAVKTLELWLSLSEEKKAEIYITLAIARAQLEQNRRALKAAKTAVGLAKEPREEWYKLLIALYYKCNDDTGMIAALEAAVGFFGPKKSYLEQLFGIYMKQERYDDALAVGELAYKHGHVTKEEEYRRLAMLYAYAGMPLDAAEVMVAGLKQGIVAETEKNLTSIYEYFLTAREAERARGYLAQAAELAGDGKPFLRLAQLLFETEHYLDAARAVETAIEKGGLDHPEEAYLLQGVAYYEGGEWEAAAKAFTRLRAYPDKRKTADSWLEYLAALG